MYSYKGSPNLGMASIKITRFKNNINNTLGRGIPI